MFKYIPLIALTACIFTVSADASVNWGQFINPVTESTNNKALEFTPGTQAGTQYTTFSNVNGTGIDMRMVISGNGFLGASITTLHYGFSAPAYNYGQQFGTSAPNLGLVFESRFAAKGESYTVTFEFYENGQQVSVDSVGYTIYGIGVEISRTAVGSPTGASRTTATLSAVSRPISTETPYSARPTPASMTTRLTTWALMSGPASTTPMPPAAPVSIPPSTVSSRASTTAPARTGKTTPAIRAISALFTMPRPTRSASTSATRMTSTSPTSRPRTSTSVLAILISARSTTTSASAATIRPRFPSPAPTHCCLPPVSQVSSWSAAAKPKQIQAG